MSRIVLASLAIVVAAWFGLGVLQAHDTSRARSLLSAGDQLTPPQARQIGSLLDTASFLNPDREIKELRGELAAERGETHRAEAIVRSVARAEPLNIAAWYALAQNATNGDTYRSALSHVNRLLRSFPAHR